jgi:hypothetical protein
MEDSTADLTVTTEDNSENELMSYLAEAMESEDDIELKPEMVSKLSGTSEELGAREITTSPSKVPVFESLEDPEPEESSSIIVPPRHQPKTRTQQADWIMILLAITFLVIVLTSIVVSILMLTR